MKNSKSKGKGKKCITQRSDTGKWQVRFVSVQTGKRVSKCFDTRQEAELWYQDAQYEDRHGSVISSDMTVNAWFKHWIEDLVTPTVRMNTSRNYRERYMRNIEPVIGRMLITDVKPLHCQKVLNNMVENYKGSTIYQTLVTMGVMFKSAEENNIVNKTPMTRAVKNPKPIENKIRFLTLEEQRKFLEAAEGTCNYAQYVVLLETGLRTGELVGLKWSDIDFENRMIRIERTLEYRHSRGTWMWGPPKSKSGYRDIPMTQKCYEVLQEVYEQYKQRTVIDKDFFDSVFLCRKGTPKKNSAYDTAIYKLCEKAQIEKFSMHTLRHTFATRCIEAGMNPKTLQVILGHSNISMTLNRYVHVTDDEKSKEINKLAEYARNEKLA